MKNIKMDSKLFIAFQVITLSLIFLLMCMSSVFAEEQRDLREGIIGEYPKETTWGFLPRFKMNPDTGMGTGIKLKGANVFGTPWLIDIANIFTSNQFQTYEALAMLPRFGACECGSYWYFMAFVEYDLIPDMRMFGVGNDTENEMFDEEDKKVGDEATVKYSNVAPRLTLGKHLGKSYYLAFQAFYREVWLDKSVNDDLPQAKEVYADLPGIEGGKTPGLAIAFLRSTRDDLWRPTKGSRLELYAEEVGPYFGADFDFTRYGADVRKYILLFGKYNVLTMHIRAETMEGEFDEMPWWELPYIGGKDSMRGYWEGRFRGRGSVLSNTEFRYNIWNPTLKLRKKRIPCNIDGNVFFDAGRVYRYSFDWVEEGLHDLKYTGGFGLRFTTPPGLMGRMDIGFSREQSFATYFNFGTVF